MAPPAADSYAATTMNGNGQAHTTGFHAAIVTHSGICPNRAETEYLGPTLETCLGAT